jgi:hypothetical protein
MSARQNVLVSILLVFLLLVGWLFFFCPEVRITPEYTQTSNCIKHIGLAFHEYHLKHGQLPPAVVNDKDGKPLYSWRVLLLPYLEQEPLYRQFKLDEPWDSPHNEQFLKTTPEPFRERADPGLTHFQVMTGPGTAFERPGLTWKKDFPDGLENTLLVVEARDPVPWSKPADLVYDPNGPLPAFSSRYKHRQYWRGFETSCKSIFVAGFADGSCRLIPIDMDEKIVRTMITRNGGEPFGAADVK